MTDTSLIMITRGGRAIGEIRDHGTLGYEAKDEHGRTMGWFDCRHRATTYLLARIPRVTR